MKPLVLDGEIITDPFESKDLSLEGIPATYEISFISRLSGKQRTVTCSPSALKLKALVLHLKHMEFTIESVESYSCEYAKERLVKSKLVIEEFLDEITLISQFENSGFYILPTSKALNHFLSHIIFGEYP